MEIEKISNTDSPYVKPSAKLDSTKLGKRLVVIDDDLDLQDLIIAFFKPRGYEVLTYADPTAVLNQLKTEGVQPDVVITDLRLPTMSGLDFIKEVKAFQPELPIILITAHKEIDTAASAVEAGAYDFVVKPLPFPQLLVSVERALHLNSIKQQNQNLKTALKSQTSNNSDGIIGKSIQFKKVLDLARRVANSNANIFIAGESGTGKEVIAHAIHNWGGRKNEPFVAINCSAIPENLLESELFGHAKGSFTGASDKKIGLFEEAGNGTLFLDEIGDLSLPLQAKLLRVLQERKIKRIGENQYRPINARIITATHKNLRTEIADGKFREDLFFRINVIPINIPPLRERRDDIIPLAEFFLAKYTAINNSPAKDFSKPALEKLLKHNWSGNVRELENSIERAAVLCNGSSIQSEDLTDMIHATEQFGSSDGIGGFDFSQLTADHVLTIDQVIKLYIQHVLNINNGAKEKTAKDLAIDRKTLYRKLQEIEHKI